MLLRTAFSTATKLNTRQYSTKMVRAVTDIKEYKALVSFCLALLFTSCSLPPQYVENELIVLSIGSHV